MARITVEKIMDRVSLVFDCEDEIEAADVYNMLASQVLDGKMITLRMVPDLDEPPDGGAKSQAANR